MKVIIDRLRYDTDKATRLAVWEGETLFQTVNGRYFIHSSADEGEEYLRPVDEAEAVRWAETAGLDLDALFPRWVSDA